MKIDNITPAALAKLLGITPETHPQCFVAETAWSPLAEKRYETGRYENHLPALNTPEADEVFAVPLMRWLSGRMIFTLEPVGKRWLVRGISHDTITSATLSAAYAAGVPEIVALFGEVE